MEDSIGFQVCNPELLCIVEDAASFDVNCAGSWVTKGSGYKHVFIHLSNLVKFYTYLSSDVKIKEVFHKKHVFTLCKQLDN